MAAGPTPLLFPGCGPLCSTRPVRRSHVPKGEPACREVERLPELPAPPAALAPSGQVGGEGAAVFLTLPQLSFLWLPLPRRYPGRGHLPEMSHVGAQNKDRGVRGRAGCGAGGTGPGLRDPDSGQAAAGLSEAQAPCDLGGRRPPAAPQRLWASREAQPEGRRTEGPTSAFPSQARRGRGRCPAGTQGDRRKGGVAWTRPVPTANLLLCVLSQEGHEKQRPPKVPLPEGHL